MKLFAGKENFDIQAHSGNIQILADKDAKITSANGELKVLAKKYIKVSAGQCQIEITEKDVNLYMPGPINIKGSLSFGGAQTGPPELPFLPKGVLPEKVRKGHLTVRIDIDPKDADHKNDTFTLKSSNGQYKQARTVKDDKVPGDHFVDLDYPDLVPDTCYSLEVKYGKDGSTQFMFEDVPATSLCPMT